MNKLFGYIVLIFALILSFSNVSAFEVCKTSEGADIKWNTSNIFYYVNTTGSPADSLTAIQAAMQTWTDVDTSSFTFLYAGETTRTEHGENDGYNIVTFGPMGLTGTLAENAFWYYVGTGQIIDSDIKFNTSYPWATDGAAYAYDVQNIGTHEHGHSLCLDDLYDAADYEKTMYGYASCGETEKRTLDEDDINGITYLYPELPEPVYIQLLTPNGGEIIPSGSMYNITWFASASIVSFDLEYSMDNGLTCERLAVGITNMNYNWLVPTPAASKKKCLVRVSGFDALGLKIVEDTSESTFKIEIIRVTSPNGGEFLKSGTEHTITWQTYGTIRPVAKAKLYYTRNKGYTWNLITVLKGNPGIHTWTIPSVSAIKNKCKVKVVLKDASGKTIGKDASNRYFTIQP